MIRWNDRFGTKNVDQVVAEIPDFKEKIAIIAEQAQKKGTTWSIFDVIEAFHPLGEPHRALATGPAGEPAPPLPPSAEQVTAEVIRLSAQAVIRDKALLDATARADRAERDLTEARARIAQLESVERVSELGAQLTQLSDEKAQLRATLSRTEKQISLLEGLMGLRGIPASAAIPPMFSEDQFAPSLQELEAEMKSANGDPAKVASVVARIEKFYGPKNGPAKA